MKSAAATGAPAFVPGASARAFAARVQRRAALVTTIVPALSVPVAVALVAGGRFGWGQAALLVVTYAMSMTGTCVGYHRLFTHRSFRAGRWLRTLLAALGSTAGQGPVVFWVAAHRKHHEDSDAAGDPHSPVAPARGPTGLVHAHVGWMLSSGPVDPVRYAPDLLKDAALRRVGKAYVSILLASIALPAAFGFVAFGGLGGAVDGLVWGGLVRIFFVQHATWAVNSICHVAGARPFASGDESRNCAWLALPTFGEAWHNNHHAFPTAAFHGMAWYQLDPAGLVIRALRRAKLVDRVVEPSPALLASKRART